MGINEKQQFGKNNELAVPSDSAAEGLEPNYGAGTISAESTITVREFGSGAFHKTVITLANYIMAITDAGANGAHGSIKLYDWLAGHIKFLGGHQDLSLLAGSGGIADAAVLDIGVGSITTGTDNDVLATTEQNIVTKADVTLSAGAGTAKSLNSTDLVLDGSDTPVDAFLNVAIEAASCSANDTLTISGTITLSWTNLGDD